MLALRVATAPAPYNLLSGSTFYTSLISQFFLPPPLPLFWLSFHLVFLLAAFTTGCSAVILPQGGRSHSGHLAPSGFPSQASPPRAGRQRPVFFVQLSASLGGGKKGRGQPVSVEHLVSRHRLAGPAGSAVTVPALGWRCVSRAGRRSQAVSSRPSCCYVCMLASAFLCFLQTQVATPPAAPTPTAQSWGKNTPARGSHVEGLCLRAGSCLQA